MATKITVTLEDDLEGGAADETVQFGLGGAAYEIDLSAKNARAFRKQLAPYIEHARRAGPAPRRRRGRTAASRQRGGGTRAWAKDQGIAVSAGGRIPGQHGAAVPGRRQTTLTHAHIAAAANQSRIRAAAEDPSDYQGYCPITAG